MDRNVRRRLGVFVSSWVLATGLVLAAGGTALASNDGGNGGNGGAGGAGGAGGNGGDSWVSGNGCGSFFCNHPAGVSRCSPAVTWCGAPRGWDLAGWLGCPLFAQQLLNELLNHAANCQFTCSR
jgi:hypothetical protein